MKRVLIEFMDSIINYVFESGADIAHDERESSEFVDIFLKDRPAKRHPDPNGVLPLTEEEREELTEAEESLFKQISEVRVEENVIKYDAGGYTYTVESIAVFQYLAERFDLEKSI